MPKFVCLTKNELPEVAGDFRSAARVEQYRISSCALYIPDGLRWKYVPLNDIAGAEESFRVISAGHCVPVREKRPELDLIVDNATVHLQLEKKENMQRILDALRNEQNCR